MSRGLTYRFEFVAVMMGTALSPSGLLAQVPDGFEVVRLTDPGLHSRPDINNRSDVIWSDSQPPSDSDIFLFSGGIVRKVTDDAFYDVQSNINDVRDFVYLTAPNYFGPADVALRQTGQTVWLGANNAINAEPDINESGWVVWHDKFSIADASDQRVFLYDGEKVHQLTFNGICNHAPRINNCGQVVFVAADTSQLGYPSTVHLYRDGELIALTDNSKAHGGTDINDLEQVVWHERELSGEGDRIMLWEDGVAVVFLEGKVGNPRINNNGDITFMQWNDRLGLWETQLYLAESGVFLAMPDFGLGATGAPINDCREIAWRALSVGTGETTVYLLRRIGSKGDCDHDCHVDSYDFAILENCFTGNGLGPIGGLLADCKRTDSDDDGDVDDADLTAFISQFTGPDQPVPSCKAVELCAP